VQVLDEERGRGLPQRVVDLLADGRERDVTVEHL
jgi:hypothetical protein